jgi:hypothetical protein
LGDVTALNGLGQAMFDNVAAVLPEAALATLERASTSHPDMAVMVWRRHLSQLRFLAYDPALFERSAELLARAATQSADEREAKAASDTFVSLFTIYLSGTHATIEQRLRVIERLLRSGEAEARTLALAALDGVLQATHFSSSYSFEFGARSRDYGWHPRSRADTTQWYGAALLLIERLAVTEGMLKRELRDLVARNFRGLWTSAQMHDELDRLARRFADGGFWREGWVACRRTMHFDRNRLTPEVVSRLSDLEIALGPSNLQERVRAVVLGDSSRALDLDDTDVDDDLVGTTARLDATARELGVAVGVDDAVQAELLPELLRGGDRAWPFGRGLAAASLDVRAAWARLVDGLAPIAPEQRNVQVLGGFLAELWERDRDVAQQLLDSALDHPALLVFLPVLQLAVGLDERGVERLQRALSTGQVPVWMYRNLAFGGVAADVPSASLKGLLLLIADQPNGVDVALEILYMRLYSDRSAHRAYEPDLLEAGRALLQRLTFGGSNDRRDHILGDVVRACLAGPDAGPTAAAVGIALRQAMAANDTYLFDTDALLGALLEVHPTAVLDALFTGNEQDRRMIVTAFEYLDDHLGNPADVIPCDALVAWCEGDCEHRYPLAASIITFARRPDASGPLVWSEQAKALLASAPDPRSVLAVFIERFQPMTWSGSRAALIESNAQLLDSLESHVPSDVMPFVIEAKAQLAHGVARERQWETRQDRARDERFE